MEKQVDKLSLGQLSGLVNSYPWFAAARMELARRLVAEGGWSREELSRLLMHIADPVLLRPFVLPLLSASMPAPSVSVPEKPRRVPGGDFFTREEYEEILNNAIKALEQESKIKVLERDEVMRKLGTVDIYQACAWIALLNDLEYLKLKICEVEE